MTAQEAVERLLDHADLLMVGGAVWMLAPVTDAVLDALATVGARAEDREPDDPAEEDDPAEDDDWGGRNGRLTDWDRRDYILTTWDRAHRERMRRRHRAALNSLDLPVTVDQQTGKRLLWQPVK